MRSDKRPTEKPTFKIVPGDSSTSSEPTEPVSSASPTINGQADLEMQAGSSRAQDEAKLDDFERRADDYILDDADGDEPAAAEEIKSFELVKQLPRFANFRSNPDTGFEMWGVADRQGMDDLVFFATKRMAPVLEDEGEIDLRRVRIYETTTTDGIVRLVYCFVPEKGTRRPNLWQTSKEAALEQSKTCWVTMRTRRKLQQYTYRPSHKQDIEPKFSGKTTLELIDQLREQGYIVEDRSHPFFKRAADTEG